MTSTTIPANVQAARDAVEGSDFFAACYLMLASYAYAGGNSPTNAVLAITDTFAAMAKNPSAYLPANMPVPNCTWQLLWGPYVTPDNSNLVYAAGLFDPVSGSPIFGAISIRGTDIAPGSCDGLITQVLQDLDVGVLAPWPYTTPGNTGANLAAGSLAGFQNRILPLGTGAKEAGGIASWVQGFAAQYPGAPLVVTGHSLGGCQATVLSAYLASKESGVSGIGIHPNPFAGPTAGDLAFANMYITLFAQTARRWYNTFDIVPMAFAPSSLGQISQMWHAGQWSCAGGFKMDTGFKTIYGGVLTAVGGKSYTQPSAGDRQLNGKCDYGTPATGYFGMVELQHFPPAYLSLMQGVPGVAWFAFPAPAAPG